MCHDWHVNVLVPPYVCSTLYEDKSVTRCLAACEDLGDFVSRAGAGFRRRAAYLHIRVGLPNDLGDTGPLGQGLKLSDDGSGRRDTEA